MSELKHQDAIDNMLDPVKDLLINNVLETIGLTMQDIDGAIEQGVQEGVSVEEQSVMITDMLVNKISG